MSKKPMKEIKLMSVDELLGVVNEESALDIPIREIHGFKNHPFKVLDDEKMEDLIESIKVNGVITPVLLRPDGRNEYEMISGHRRMHAAIAAGLDAIPAIIRDMDDDEAVVTMVDANMQREELLPSEKAFAYKMKLDAMKRQGKRTDLTSGQNGPKLTVDIISEETGDSSRQIKRYIRLTELIPEFLDLVDRKRLPFTSGVEISYIDKEVQRWMYEYLRDFGILLPEQIRTLRRYLEQGPMTRQMMISVLNSCIQPKETPRRINLNEKKLSKYFPPSYSNSEMMRVIESLLEIWKQNQDQEQEESEYEENDSEI